MKHVLDDLRELAAQVNALQATARELGMFTNERELLTCPACGLTEDVTADALLVTYHQDSASEDTGLRFEELAHSGFRCPSCGSTLREPVEDAMMLKKPR